jgi:hypothetical protein
MRKATVLLLLITTMNMITVESLLDSQDYSYEGGVDTDDILEGEGEIEMEDSDSAGRDVEEETVGEESLDRTSDEEWLNTAVQDIAYYLRAHKFNDFDRRYHEDEETAPRVSSLVAG